MRILVLSDSHGDYFTLKKVIEAQPTAEVVVFLGDGLREFERCASLLKGKRVYAVKGNNDDGFDYPTTQIISVGGIRIYITHGQQERVKANSIGLLAAAKENECALALYGHTHRQGENVGEGVRIFNPGALQNDEYGIIDIYNGRFICIGIKIR